MKRSVFTIRIILIAYVTAGAELVFFSPLSDSLPDVDAVYLGGGYPELHLPALESSRCTQEIETCC